MFSSWPRLHKGKDVLKFNFELHLCDVRGIPERVGSVCVHWEQGGQVIQSQAATTSATEQLATLDTKLRSTVTLYRSAKRTVFAAKPSIIKVVNTALPQTVIAMAEFDLAQHANLEAGAAATVIQLQLHGTGGELLILQFSVSSVWLDKPSCSKGSMPDVPDAIPAACLSSPSLMVPSTEQPSLFVVDTAGTALAATDSSRAALDSRAPVSPSIIALSSTHRAIVFGSINMDMKATAFATWPTHELSRSSTASGEFHQSVGGRGANEAVAIARLGVNTWLVGRVGNDPAGSILRQELSRQANLDVSHVLMLDGVATSTAIQIVTKHHKHVGDEISCHFTVSCAEANLRLEGHAVDTATQLMALRPPAALPAVLVLQLEINVEATKKVLEAADQLAIPVAFKPSPMPSQDTILRSGGTSSSPNGDTASPGSSWSMMDWKQSEAPWRILESGAVGAIFANEREAPQLLGWPEEDSPVLNCALAEEAAKLIMRRYPSLRSVVVTCAVCHVLCERSGGWLRASAQGEQTDLTEQQQQPSPAPKQQRQGQGQEQEDFELAVAMSVSFAAEEERMRREQLSTGQAAQQYDYRWLRTSHPDVLRLRLPGDRLVPLRPDQQRELQRMLQGEPYNKDWLLAFPNSDVLFQVNPI